MAGGAVDDFSVYKGIFNNKVFDQVTLREFDITRFIQLIVYALLAGLKT